MTSWKSRFFPTPTHSDTPFHATIVVCCSAILSYLAARLGGALVLRPDMIWAVWPGCAFLVAVLLLAPRKIWPAVVIAGLSAFAFYDVQEALPVRSIVLLLLADAIEILIAALGVTYVFGGVPRLNSVKSLAKYSLFAVILAPISVASIAVKALESDSWWVGFFTEALALLTLTPAILSWADVATKRVKRSHARYLEAIAMGVGLAILSYFTFVASGIENRPAILYSLMPFLLWSALRFGIAGTSNSLTLVAFLAVLGAVRKRGPFTGDTPIHAVLSLQLFLLVAASSFMVLAAVVEDDKTSEQALGESEERLRLAAKAGNMFAYSWDAATDAIERTGESAEVLGVGHAALTTGAATSAMVHPDDKNRLQAARAKLSVGNPTFQMTYRIMRPDGAVVWVDNYSRAYFDGGRNLKQMVGMVVDVTERRRAEESACGDEPKTNRSAGAGTCPHWEGTSRRHQPKTCNVGDRT
jgi:PAS domain S-box-containing protein